MQPVDLGYKFNIQVKWKMKRKIEQVSLKKAEMEKKDDASYFDQRIYNSEGESIADIVILWIYSTNGLEGKTFYQ